MEKTTEPREPRSKSAKKEFDLGEFTMTVGMQALVYAAQGACIALGGLAATSVVDSFRSSPTVPGPLADGSNVSPISRRVAANA